MSEAVLTHRHADNRRHRTSLDGVAIERRYLYLRPDVWQALEALMQRTGTRSQSMTISELILHAANPLKGAA